MPKKRRETPQENSEEVKPQTVEQKVAAVMPDLLADAAKARTESIKLAEVPYATELSQQLLAQAQKLEGFYKKLGSAVARAASEKTFKSLLAEVEEANAFTAKAQAWSVLAGVANLLFIAGLWSETM